MSILYYFIDEETRKLRPEAAHKVVAQKDHNADVIRVGIPETMDSVDLETSAVRCMYQRPKETEVRSKTAAYYDTSGGYLWYDWTLQEGDTAKAGKINFSVCLQHIEGGLLAVDWNTTIGEIHVKTSYHSDDGDEGDESITPTVAQRVAVLESVVQSIAGGAPVVVDSTSDMTDTEKLYVLSTDGMWYYYDGSAWTAGGEYGAVSTDTTLTRSGIPADAEVVGNAINAVSAEITGIKDDIKDIPGGIPDTQKRLIIAIMRNSLYSSDQSENIDTLENLFFADIPATSISLNQSSISLIADEQEERTFALIATVHPVYTTDAVVWTSSNDTVATVSDNGLVTAIAPGTVIITARAGDVSAQCNVVVSADELTSINAVYRQTQTVYERTPLDSLKDDLTVTAVYESGKRSVLADYDYALSGSLVAGTSTITATYGGFSATFNVTVSALNLDTIAYENKSYRDIFMTGNMLVGTDFENGLPSGWEVNSGSPEITTGDYSSAGHSVKAFGTSSAQYKALGTSVITQLSVTVGKTYYNAFMAKCTRYVAGNLGVSVLDSIHANEFRAVTGITNGWVVSSAIATAASNNTPNRFFVGSYTSANLDGYIDDIVHINLTDMFTTIPSKETMDELYETYCTLRNGGVS